MTPNTLTLIVASRKESANHTPCHTCRSDYTHVEAHLEYDGCLDRASSALPDRTSIPPGITAASIHIKGWSHQMKDYAIGSHHLITIEPLLTPTNKSTS